MKIKETIERECCNQTKDLKSYKGITKRVEKILFCIHCGQLWEWKSCMDVAGGTVNYLDKIEV